MTNDGIVSAASEQRGWPPDPYKGLTYYGPDDIPLFAGRNTDVRRVARILDAGPTRILLLHGSIGCGKWSFLRAALIPFLETEVKRFNFAKEAASAKTTLFVRSSHDPLVELASKAWEYAKSDTEQSVGTQTPQSLGNEAASVVLETQPQSALYENGSVIEKSKVSRYAIGPLIDLKQYNTIARFTSAVSDDPERLVDLIGRIAYRRPRTQALIVDQAEEVLTLKPGREGDDARRRFFMFLTYLSYCDLNFRLIVVFRTEYHGRFYAALKSAGIDASSVDDYYLADLTGHDLVDAITRPTSIETIQGYGVPREYYRFYYEEGLPELIAKDLERAPLAGGLLPVLQIVCRRLYQKAKESSDVNGYFLIRTQSYRELGGIHGQVDLHLQQGLEKCAGALSTSKLLVAKLESLRWRDVLAELAKPQPDGTVTTDVKPAKTLSELSELKRCKLPFDGVMGFLSKEEWKIVRPVELTKPNGEKVPCFSLGHDVLGGVLERWKTIRKKDRSEVRRLLVFSGVSLLVGSLAVSSPSIAAILYRVGWNLPLLTTRIILDALGVSSLLFAAIPDSKVFGFLYQPIYGFFTDLTGARRLPGERAEPT